MAAQKKGWTAAAAVDWNNVSTEKPKPPAEGVYRAEITDGEPEATQAGKAGARLVFTLREPFGGGESVDRKVKDKLAIQDETFFKVKQLALACSVSPPVSPVTEDSVETFCNDLIDSKGCYVLTRNDSFNGEEYARVSRYLTEAQAAELAAAMGGATGASSDAAPTERRSGRRQRGKPAEG